MARQTPPSVQAESVLKQKFPGMRFGRYNCRKISGSTYWSQHSWHNALDLYPPKHISYATQRQEYQDYLDLVNAFIVANFTDLNVRVKLWRVRNHYNHIHIDFWPRGWGTPPCAGGSPRYKYPNGDVRSTTRLIHTYDGPLDPVKPKEKDMLIKGDEGLRVERAQKRLLELGYTLPQWGADGDFGNETEAAVKQFQHDTGLPEDGILYSVDISILFEEVGKGSDDGALELAQSAHSRLNKLREV